MEIRYLKLNNFRNYSKLEINFDDRLNIIFGENGMGKTNIVEAIYSLSLTKSFRTINDRNLIKLGEDFTKIEGEINHNYENNYQVIISKEGKKVKIDNKLVSKISDYITNFIIVLLEPNEHKIFSESPSNRRKLINIAISQLDSEYIYNLNNYNKILKQRNMYLKQMFYNGNASVEYLDILTKKLIDYGLKIYKSRYEFVEKINCYLNDIYEKIYDYGELKINYRSSFKDKKESELIEEYQKNYNKDINLKKTHHGIHHDDIEILLDGKNIAIIGSNGQQKNAILSFKLAQIEVVKEQKGYYPIIILDDLFSALDNKKSEHIVDLLINYETQTFITTTEIEKLEDKLINKAKIFKVCDGEITEVENGR